MAIGSEAPQFGRFLERRTFEKRVWLFVVPAVVGLTAPPQGQEYRIDVVKANGERTSVGALSPDERGAGFALARDVPEGATQVAIRLAPQQPKKEGEAQGGAQQQPPTQ